MTFTNGNSTKFFYSAEGEKLRAVNTTGSITTQIDYCGNIIYEAGEQKYLLNQEGYYDLEAGGYHYYLKDHLGNNRVVITQSGAVEQTTHYYPYGGTFASTSNGSNTQPYKYNGKELDAHNGLNWYDYGARHYDPAIARWTTQDPLAEKYYGWNQYNYCGANPIIYIDPDGTSVYSKIGKAAIKLGKIVYKKGVKALSEKGSYLEAFSDVVENFNTLTDENASGWGKAGAIISIGTEFLPISLSDASDVIGLVKKVHGNSKASTKAQHAYDIIDKHTRKVVKTGISGGGVRKSDDKSMRAEQQVRVWNKEAGEDRFKSEITYSVPEGEGARDRILEYEKKRAKELNDKGELDKTKHKRP